MSYAMFTKPEECTDYLAVVQIAVLYLDAPCENGTSWQAEAVIADVIVLLGRWIQIGWYKVEADSEKERIANRKQCKSAIRTSLFGVDRDLQRDNHALSARFMQLVVGIYAGQFTHERLRSIYEKPLISARSKLGLTIESKRARSFLAECHYKELGCRELAQAYLDKGAQSKLVSRIRDDLGSEASTPVPVVPPHWKLDAITPVAFWTHAAERGWSKESFKGKAIVFIEPERDASAAMKLAASVRWKDGDRILDMLDPWSLEEAKKAGLDICGTPHSLPGKDCIGIADPVIVKRRSEQIVRVVEALKTGIKMLARVLPQDELWMSRHRAVTRMRPMSWRPCLAVRSKQSTRCWKPT